jgi:DNA-binding protein Alba
LEVKKLKKNKIDEGIIIVGKKPVMNYVVAGISCFKNGMKEIKIISRGKVTSKAIDTAELIKRHYPKIVVSDMEIGTEKIDVDGQKKDISNLKIILNTMT